MLTVDFETYSEAGLKWSEAEGRFKRIVSNKGGLQLVGAWAYAEHPSTEVLSLAYDFMDGRGCFLWVPGMPLPQELFDYVHNVGPLNAWNSFFEYCIWNLCAVPKYGFPPIETWMTFDDAALSRAAGLPPDLNSASNLVGASVTKDKAGHAVMMKLCQPKKPTKKDPAIRYTPQAYPELYAALYKYNITDVWSEHATSQLLDNLTEYERKVWLMDQGINARGMQIDLATVELFIESYETYSAAITSRLITLTGGRVKTASEQKKICEFLGGYGVFTDSVDEDNLDMLLALELHPVAREVLEIRQKLRSSSVKKLYALKHMCGSDGRLHGAFIYHGADRTGRFTGGGPQPHNMPSGGPNVCVCPTCGNVNGEGRIDCAWCLRSLGAPPTKWKSEYVDSVVALAHSGHLEPVHPDVVGVISGCIRGMFCAGPGKELICSDFSAIEAVVLACLAGEQWRIDVFRTHGKIYETTAARVAGVPFESVTSDHPLRKMGKVAELASGYQGAVGAWVQFGALEFMTEDEIKSAVKAWRKDSPMIVKFWYQIEEAAVAAVGSPGQWFGYRGIWYISDGNRLRCFLPSGRALTYQRPRLVYNKFNRLAIQFEGWNTDSTKGPRGWMAYDTYGGKLTENIVQAVARDILVHAMLNLEAAGYPVVLHVHDEPCSEVPLGYGSIEEYERIMQIPPAWAADWPIRASGGWRGQRFRK